MRAVTPTLAHYTRPPGQGVLPPPTLAAPVAHTILPGAARPGARPGSLLGQRVQAAVSGLTMFPLPRTTALPVCAPPPLPGADPDGSPAVSQGLAPGRPGPAPPQPPGALPEPPAPRADGADPTRVTCQKPPGTARQSAVPGRPQTPALSPPTFAPSGW